MIESEALAVTRQMTAALDALSISYVIGGSLASPAATLTEQVVLPVPPFCMATAMIRVKAGVPPCSYPMSAVSRNTLIT